MLFLFTVTLTIPLYPKTLENEEDKIVDIFMIMESFLTGDLTKSEEKALSVMDKYLNAGSDIDDPVVVITDYLSGNKTIDREIIFEASEDYDAFSGLCSLAQFVREVANGNLKPIYLKANLLNYQRIAPKLSFEKITAKDLERWRLRMLRWNAWCDSQFTKIEDLEPLLLKNSNLGVVSDKVSKDLASLNLVLLKKMREPYANRSRPVSFDFNKDEMQIYINTLKFDAQKRSEIKRINFIGNIKDFVARSFARSEYKGIIKLKNKTITGTIFSANQNTFLIKVGNKQKEFKWSDITFPQYMEILKYFVKRRLTSSGGTVTKGDKIKLASKEIARIAMLCDWYGEYEEALKLAKIAVSCNAEMKPIVEELLYGEQGK